MGSTTRRTVMPARPLAGGARRVRRGALVGAMATWATLSLSLSVPLTSPPSLPAAPAAAAPVAPSPSVLTGPWPASAARGAPGGPPGLVAGLVGGPADHGDGGPATGRGRLTGAVLADVAAAEPITGRAVGSTVGQLLSEDDGRQRLCTATLIASRTQSVLVSAAHCVYTPPQVGGSAVAAPGEQGWVDSTVFVPGVDGAQRPFGVWEVEEIAVDPSWQTSADPVHDVAFLRLAPRDGQSAGEVLGAQGIGQAADQPSGPLSAVGYPAAGAEFTGDEVLRCAAEQPGVEPLLGGDYTIPCDMTEGSSGGPWLAELDETTGLGVVVAVTSVRVVGDDRIAAARLGEDAMALFAAVDDQPTESSDDQPAESSEDQPGQVAAE